MSNLFRRVINKVKVEGIQKSSQGAVTFLYDHLYDFKYKIDTFSWVEKHDLGEDTILNNHAVWYQATRVLALRKLFKTIQIAKDSVLVDIGCGKGRVLLIASEFGFKIARGVDFSTKLCEIANKNIDTYKNHTQAKTKFEIINCDASNYQFHDDEEIFFLFNPFDEFILKNVLVNIKESLYRNKRNIILVYAYPVSHQLILDEMNIISVGNYCMWNILFSVFEIS